MRAMSNVVTTSPVRKLILDSGASLHIVRRRKGVKLKKGPRFSIQTANGIVSSNKYHVVYVPGLGDVDGLVLEETLDLMGMGLFIKQFSLRSFDDYNNPYLISANGDKIVLRISKDVPILDLENLEVITKPVGQFDQNMAVGIIPVAEEASPQPIVSDVIDISGEPNTVEEDDRNNKEYM